MTTFLTPIVTIKSLRQPNCLIESLPDEQVLALCDLQMEPQQQEALSKLLECNREGQLTEVKVSQLDALMQVYRRGLVRNAKALKAAVSRGLRPALSE